MKTNYSNKVWAIALCMEGLHNWPEFLPIEEAAEAASHKASNDCDSEQIEEGIRLGRQLIARYGA